MVFVFDLNCVFIMDTVFRQHLEKVIELTDEEYDYISSHFTSKKLKKHNFVVQEGLPVNYEYFVVGGLLKASYLNEQGKEHILQFAMENWWVTDYHAFVMQTPATLNIDCIEDVELLMLSFTNKRKLCTESHKMEHFFRMKTTMGYISLQQRILSLLNSDAQSRYRQFFSLYPQLFQRIPKALIASYLGVSRETLSRMSHAEPGQGADR
jgi:CRP-like cAMP-binding protein